MIQAEGLQVVGAAPKAVPPRATALAAHPGSQGELGGTEAQKHASSAHGRRAESAARLGPNPFGVRTEEDGDGKSEGKRREGQHEEDGHKVTPRRSHATTGLDPAVLPPHAGG